MHLDLLPTQVPIEDLLEVQDSTDDRHTEIQILENMPYNIYETSGGNPSNIDNTQELDIEVDVNLLAYDVDQTDTPYCSNRTIFVHTETPESNLCLAQPANKVKKTWYNQMSKSELNVDPDFAIDHACYEMETILDDVTSNVIQATYLGPLKDIPNQPTLALEPGQTKTYCYYG